MATTKTSNVGYEALNSANVRISNKGDENRAYDISANVNIREGVAQNFESGSVSKQDESGARNITGFSKYGDNNLTVSFNVETPEEQVTVLAAVQNFITDTKSLIVNKPMSANL